MHLIQTTLNCFTSAWNFTIRKNFVFKFILSSILKRSFPDLDMISVFMFLRLVSMSERNFNEMKQKPIKKHKRTKNTSAQ